MTRKIDFVQLETREGIATGMISFELPPSLVAIGQEVQYSVNGKVLPFYEGTIEFEVVLDDGTVTTISGNLALWYNKKHVKAAIQAKEEADKEAAKRAKEEELRKKRAELLKIFSDEQIQALAALGMIDKEGD